MRQLAKILCETCDDFMSGEDATARTLESQLVTSSRAASAANDVRVSASQPTTNGKQNNPYSWILANVVDSAPDEIGTEYAALHSASKKPRAESFSAIQCAMRLRTLAKPLNLDTRGDRTVPVHVALLKRFNIPCTVLTVSALRNLTETIEMRIAKMLEHRENRVLNNAEFLRKFVRARKVCPHTADDVIVKLEDRAISPDIALEIIADHTRHSAYVLMGRQCPIVQAMEVQDRLEPGKHTYAGVNHLVQNNRRLDHGAMALHRYSVEYILREIERLRHPHAIGFKTPTILELPRISDACGKDGLCLVHIMDRKDFANGGLPKVQEAIRGRHDVMFFIVQSSHDESMQDMVSEVSHVVRSGVKLISLYVEQWKQNAEVWSRGSRMYEAAFFAGCRGSVWQLPTLEAHLAEYKIVNTINNEQMRRLMYDAKAPREETVDPNKYNTVYAHSGTPIAIEILANLALNRVACSLTGAALVQFTEDLTNAQRARTTHGGTIADPPLIVRERRKKGKDNVQNGE